MIKTIMVKYKTLKKLTKTNSPTGYSGATNLPPVGNSFMYKETSSNNHGNNVLYLSSEQMLFRSVI